MKLLSPLPARDVPLTSWTACAQTKPEAVVGAVALSPLQVSCHPGLVSAASQPCRCV